MVWSCLKVFWFSKDNPTGNSERKQKKEADRRRGGKTISKSGQEWTLPAQLRQLKTSRWNGIVANSFVVPRRLWDRIDIERFGGLLFLLFLSVGNHGD